MNARSTAVQREVLSATALYTRKGKNASWGEFSSRFPTIHGAAHNEECWLWKRDLVVSMNASLGSAFALCPLSSNTSLELRKGMCCLACYQGVYDTPPLPRPPASSRRQNAARCFLAAKGPAPCVHQAFFLYQCYFRCVQLWPEVRKDRFGISMDTQLFAYISRQRGMKQDFFCPLLCDTGFCFCSLG